MDKTYLHKSLLEELHETYIRKNKDYGDSFSRTYKNLGIISAITRISDKYNRLVNLAKNNNPQVTNESITDTLLDMANYCIMTVMEIAEERNEITKGRNNANE